jgi:hypothetical protein
MSIVFFKTNFSAILSELLIGCFCFLSMKTGTELVVPYKNGLQHGYGRCTIQRCEKVLRVAYFGGILVLVSCQAFFSNLLRT